MPSFGPQLALPFTPLPLRLTLTRPTQEGSQVSPETQELMFQTIHRPAGVDPQLWRQVVAHPDELVLWTAINAGWQFEHGAGGMSRDVESAGAAVARALRDATAERVMWTPVLDALAHQPYLWNANALAQYARVMQRTGCDPVTLLLPTEQADLAIPGIQQATTPEVTQALQYFRAKEIRTRLVSHVTTIDDDLIRAVLRWPGGERKLAARPDLTPSQVEKLYTWSLDRFEREAAMPLSAVLQHGGSGNGHLTRLLRVADILVARHGAMPESVRTRLTETVFTALQDSPSPQAYGRPGVESPFAALYVAVKDPGITHTLLTHVVRNVKEARVLAMLLTNPSLTAMTRQPVHRALGEAYNRSSAILALEDIPEAVFVECVPLFVGSSTEITTALKHKSATPIVARRFVELKFDSDTVRDTLVTIPAFRNDPEIRARLLRCRVPSVLRSLIAESTREEFAVLWPRLLHVNSGVALELLEQKAIPAGFVVSSESLAPMLMDKHADADRVSRIMLIMNDITAAADIPESERPLVRARAPARSA